MDFIDIHLDSDTFDFMKVRAIQALKKVITAACELGTAQKYDEASVSLSEAEHLMKYTNSSVAGLETLKRICLERMIGDGDLANLLLVKSSDPIERVEASATCPRSGHKRRADNTVNVPVSARHSVEDDDVENSLLASSSDPIECGKAATARPRCGHKRKFKGAVVNSCNKKKRYEHYQTPEQRRRHGQIDIGHNHYKYVRTIDYVNDY